MNRWTRSLAGRSLGLGMAALVATLGCRPTSALAAIPGAYEYQLVNLIPVPGGVVNAAGGNLLVERVDMTIDTMFGTQAIGAVYNAARGDWLWGFEARFEDGVFVDSTGARHDASALQAGDSIAGTVWILDSANSVRTKGGWSLHFDAQGQLAHAQWATIDYPRIDYRRHTSAGSDVLTIEQCSLPGACTAFFEVVFDGGGRPVGAVDTRTGRAVEYQWDGDALVAVRDPLAVARGWPGTRYEYDSWTGLLAAAVSAEGERIEYAYQAGARIRSVTRVGAAEGNPTDWFEFDAPMSYSGGLYTTIHTNPLGGRTRYRYDGTRRLRLVELVETGESATLAWSGLRPSRTTTADGSETRYTYTGDDLTRVVAPSGNVIDVTPELGGIHITDPYARPIRRIDDSLGVVQIHGFDAQGRVTSTTNGEGEMQQLAWGPLALSSVTNAAGVGYTLPLYGIHGHWLEQQSEGLVTERRAFDAVGNLVIASAGRHEGGVLTRGYDPNRQLESIDVAASAAGVIVAEDAISVSRRSDGQLLYVARPGGADHSFEYDALGRLARRSERVDGTWQPTEFERDAAGHVTVRLRPNGMREEYDYDLHGRLVAHRASRNGVPEGEATFVHRDGHLAEKYDSIRDTTEFYGYDAAGRLGSIAFSSGESASLEYDLRSRPTAETLALPGQGTLARIEYTYDLANRPTRLATGAGEVLVEWTFHDGALEEIRTGNGLVRSLQTDPASGDLVSAQTVDAQAAVVETTQVATSIESAPPREQVRTQTSTPLATTIERYALTLGGSLADPNRYVGQRVFGWDDEAGASSAYAYDGLSNRVDASSGDAFAYNAEGNRLMSAVPAAGGGAIDFTWDAAGFATTRAGVPIAWTATGRMASYGANSIVWDMSGRPVSSTIDGQSQDFALFGGRISSDLQTGALGPLDLGVVSLSLAGPERLYRHFDFRNNVSFTSDETGAIVSHYHYSAYGVNAVFGATDDPVRFAGRQQLGELVHLGARIYDPATGRFLSPDPEFGFANQYAYTLGNPLRYWDPDGASQRSMARAAAGILMALFVAASIVAVITGATALSLALAAIAAGIGLIVATEVLVSEIMELGTHDRIDVDAFDGVPSSAGPCRSRCGPKRKRVKEITIEVEADGPVGEETTTAFPSFPQGCAPTRLTQVPQLGWLLVILVPLQLILGWLVLRRRERGGPG